ncbi:MAG: FCD domain-containing protein [Clostridium sp.]|nr:MAG: FCD domain-containing protein [Clostridium sp.]
MLEQKELINEKLLDDSLLFDDYDKEFHIGIAKALNNNYIEKEISRVLDLSERIRFFYLVIKSHERYVASLYEHLNIVEAMLNKDEDIAYDAMLKHLYNTLEGFKNFMKLAGIALEQVIIMLIIIVFRICFNQT